MLPAATGVRSLPNLGVDMLQGRVLLGTRVEGVRPTDRRVGTADIDVASFGSAAQTGGQRSDTIMVVHLDPATGSASLLSIPRDLWVPIAGMGDNRGLSDDSRDYGPVPESLIVGRALFGFWPLSRIHLL